MNLLYDADHYPLALRALKRKYGHPYLIAKSHIDSINDLIDLPRMKNDDFKSLRSFGEQLKAAVASLSISGFAAELKSTSLIAGVIEKLPMRLRREWGSYVYEKLPHVATLGELNDWLEERCICELYVSSHTDFTTTEGQPRSSTSRRATNHTNTFRRPTNHSNTTEPRHQKSYATTQSTASTYLCPYCQVNRGKLSYLHQYDR